MSTEVSLSAEAGRALQEAENFCWRSNVGIVAPEHVLAGCLVVLNAAGVAGLPSDQRVAEAMLLAQGMSDDALTQNVMFGSAAREAISFTAALVRQAGGGEIDPRTLASGVIQSGEVGPMFFSSLRVTKSDLVGALANSVE